MLFGAVITFGMLLAAACGGSNGASGDPTVAEETSSLFPVTIVVSGSPVTPRDSTPNAVTPDRTPTPTVTGQGAIGTPPASTACTPARPHAPGDTNGAINSGGLDRTYILHVPPAYDGVDPMPVVFNLHGFGSNAQQQANYSGFPAKADTAGFIVVSPNGTGNPQMWAFPFLGTVDEPAFLAELLDRLETELCIDAARVYAAGMSNGAAISTYIACALPDRIAAIAEVAATAGPRLCATKNPIPIITFRGTEDICVPYEGGTSQCGLNLPVISADEAIRLWGEHNTCNEAPATTRFAADVLVTAYSECSRFTAALLYTIEGGGHTWPGAVDVPRLGTTTHTINATDLIWEFFQGHAN
jgi:polyhydroxybutyrate depolymerase